MLTCSSCGSQLDDGAKFCGKCGKAVTSRFTSAQARQTLQFGPVEKKLEVLAELNRVGNVPLADIQPQLDALAFAGHKTPICLYAIRALIVLGDTRDRTIDALASFLGDPQFFKDDNDNILRFPWVPRDLPQPEEDFFNLGTRVGGAITRRIEGNFLHAVIETLSHAKGSDKAGSILGRFLSVFEGSEDRVLCMYAMGALGHPANRTALEYYRDNLADTPEGRAAKLSLQCFGTLSVFDLIRKHAETYAKPLAAAKSGCFVATAAFGDASSPAVMALRTFRDGYLLRSRVGRLAVTYYYRISPTVARRIQESPTLTGITRGVLKLLIRCLPSSITLKPH